MDEKYLFTGFPDGETGYLILPPSYFSSYLPLVDDLDELKLNLVFLQVFGKTDTLIQLSSLEDLNCDQNVMNIFNGDHNRLKTALRKSVERGSLLQIFDPKTNKTFYTLSASYSRLILDQIESGTRNLDSLFSDEVILRGDTSNIFKLYEENIGILTPIITEILIEDEKEFSASWIREAIQIAVENNARNWKYVHAILVSWKNEGKDGRDKKNTQRTRDQLREKWLGKNGGN